MKRTILILLISLAAGTVGAAVAQSKGENKFTFATTLGTGISLGGISSTPVTWQAIGYYNLTGRWSVGAGTGLSFYEKMLIPVFGDVRYQIGRERLFTPYVELAAGYSLAPAGTANGGLFLNPSAGVQFPLKNRLKLQLAVGYELQKLERLKTSSDSYFDKAFTEKLIHNSLSTRLGVLF
jgi:hypothetical protein